MKLNIARKLRIMVVSAILALCLVSGLGYLAMSRQGQSLKYMGERTIPGMQTVYRLEANQQRLTINLLGHVLTDDKSQMQTLEKGIEQAMTDMRRDFQDYAARVPSGKGREFLDSEQKIADAYFKVIPVVLDQSRINDKLSATVYLNQLAHDRDSLAALIRDHIAYINSSATAAIQDAERSEKNSLLISVVVFVLTALLIGILGTTLAAGINRSLRSIVQAVEQIESRLDFTTQAPVMGHDEISMVSAALNRLTGKLREHLLELAEGARRVASASTELVTSSRLVADVSSGQSDSASSMAASVEEMTVSINHISSRSNEAYQLSASSGQLAEEGLEVINQTVQDINAIALSVKEVSQQIGALEQHGNHISSIVSVIKDVAEQTNLLALNAAIEAARAGEQGRGFAVVADEVRKLAERTASSTKEIGSMIQAIRDVSQTAVGSMNQAVALVDTGVNRANNANDAIQKIGAGSHQSVVMVEEISAAIREQSQTSNLIAESVEKIAQMSEESSAAAKNSAASASQLDQLAADMQKIVAEYKL